MALHIILAGALERKGDYEGAIFGIRTYGGQTAGNLIVANNLASLLLEPPVPTRRASKSPVACG
jgi:hypothetical protein